MFLGGNSSGRAQPTISPRLLRPMCGMAQSSLRIALPKKPSGSAGRFWPNHRIHVLKAKALLFSSDYGRGFGSVFHHHTQGPGQSPGPFSCLKSLRHAGFRPPVLRVTITQNARKRPLSPPEPSLFSVWPAGRRRWWSSKINNLRASVHRQPRPPVTTATRRRASLVLTLRQLI